MQRGPAGLLLAMLGACLAPGSAAAWSAPQEPAQLEAALERAFPAAQRFVLRAATLNEAQRAQLAPQLRSRKSAPHLWSYREAWEGEKLLGRAIVDDVIGKSLPITYLVSLETDNRVRAVEVLVYRESHGGEVKRDKWRAQFVGKGLEDPLALGRDVRNIAGATLSCRALCEGVHDALAIAGLVFASPTASPATVQASWPRARTLADTPGCFARTQLAMGTLLELRAVAPNRAHFDAAADSAFAAVERLESLWSTWRPESEISKLNAAEPGAWCALSPATTQLLARAASLRATTRGAFAVESGALVELWQAAAAAQREPEPASIAQAREACAETAFELDLELSRARRSHAAARLDLGAIGKGAALDEIAREFRARGLPRAVFDFGGQLLALEGPREGAGWPVTLRDPRAGADAGLWELELQRASLATSADDQRGWLIAGKRRSHVVDPRSGNPADALLCACALSSTGADADVWSTAAFVLGRSAAAPLAEANGVRLLLLERDGGVWTSPGFPGRGVAR